MRIVRFRPDADAEPRLGAVTDDGRITELDVEATTLEAALERGHTWDSLEATGDSHDEDDVVLEAPLDRPHHVLGVGLNHEGHADEVGHEIPDEPLFFAKSTASLAGPDDPVVHHDIVDTLQYEAELAVIVGERTRNVTPEEAADRIFGYTLANDVTAHDMQMADVSASRPWYRSKCLDTFTPVGPYVASGDEVALGDETVTASLNGEEVQRLAVSDRVFDGPEIVAEISDYFTLQPGDVVLTGTADGIGEMRPGDTVEVASDSLGTLTNEIVD